jgi:hypothetical protein
VAQCRESAENYRQSHSVAEIILSQEELAPPGPDGFAWCESYGTTETAAEIVMHF